MKKIENIQDYVDSLRKIRPTIRAIKCTCVRARIGREGEKVATYVSDGTLETVNTVKRDEDGNLDVVVTMADKEGNAITYKDGRTNVIVIPRRAFDEKYEDVEGRINPNTELLFRPKGEIKEFIQITEDITFTAPWGKEMVLKAGGYLNISDADDVYGIAYEEFLQTYQIVGE